VGSACNGPATAGQILALVFVILLFLIIIAMFMLITVAFAPLMRPQP
jgi:hypothetical protein